MNVSSNKEKDEVNIKLSKREAEILALLLGAINRNKVDEILAYYKGRKGYPEMPKPECSVLREIFFKLANKDNLDWYSKMMPKKPVDGR